MHKPKVSALLIALLAEVVLFHRKVLFYPGYIFPWDFRAVHLPLATFVADSLRRGEFPLWDPYTYCGFPFFANIQAAIYYPPVLAATLFGTLLGSDVLPRALAVGVVLQMFFAGACTFALLRRLGAQPAAAWIAGTVYELGCYFTSQAEHMGAVEGACWLPLAWWCVVELGAGFRWFWAAMLSIALAMSVLAGLPQAAVAVFGSALALAIIMALLRLARWKLPVQVLVSWVWALALVAVQFIPTTQLMRLSVAKYRADWLGSGGGLKLGSLISLAIRNYWNVFDPSKFHGPSDLTFLYLYSSILGLALAIAAVVWKPDAWRGTFGLLTAGGAVWMLGDSTPVGRAIFGLLPLSIRAGLHFEYTFCIFSLGIAVLAGCGANRFLRSSRIQLLAGIIIAVDLLLVGSGRPFNTALLAAEPGITHDAADGSAELITRLRALTGTARPAWRFDMAEAPYLWSSSAPILAIPTANGCDVLVPERIIQVRLSFSPGQRWGACYQVVNAASPVLRLANVRYVVSRGNVPALQPVTGGGAYGIYENSRALPRFFLVNRVTCVEGLAESAKMLHSNGFDPGVAIVETPACPAAADSGGTVDVIEYGATRLAVQTHASGATFLVATEQWYPGWEATVDGRPAPIYITDVAFRGVALPAGDHRVDMRFVPRILYPSAAISLLALTGVVCAIVFRRKRSG